MQLAVDHEVCRMKVGPNTAAPELMTDLDAVVRIGDEILVPGNAEGAGVIKPFHGRIVGIGPNLVEVDAPFVPGNSGSPIIHQASGKVVGVATYLMTRKVDQSGTGKVETVVRRFGYRIDSVKQWEAVNWPRFYAQSAQTQQIESFGAEFLKLFENAKAGHLASSDYTNPGIRRALQAFESKVRANGTRMSTNDDANARRNLLADLRVATRADLFAFDSRNAYDFFRRTLILEQKFREDLYTGFTQAISSVDR